MISYWNSLADFGQFDFMLNALLGTILTALICGILSPLIIARRYALIGPAISHSTILGVSSALVFFSFSDSLPIFFTTLGITSILVLFLARSTF
ncbi:MAG: hypothetical protein HN730_04785, partial [Bdellovibrionales bacterium]|nr:hypothetical protein [Bdellovibrionales bacterium]